MAKAYKYYRLTTTDFRRNGTGPVTYASMAEFYLYDKEGNDISTLSGSTYTQDSMMDNNASYNAAKAFDRNTSTMWHSDHDYSLPYTHWIQIQLPEAKVIKSIGITPRSDYALDVPYAFYLEGSNDGSTYDTILTMENVSSGWSMGTNRVFTLPEDPNLYLLRQGDILHTFENDELIILEDVELNSELFESRGFEDIALVDLIIAQTLEDFEILAYNASEVVNLQTTVTATPQPQTITSENIIFNSGVTGIQNIEVNADENTLFLFSIDDGATWKAFDNTNETWVELESGGMNKTEVEALTLSQISSLLGDARQLKIKFTLNAIDNYVNNINIYFTNS